MERLLKPRGKLNNLYKQSWGDSGWIFADYTPGAKTTKNVVIAAINSLERWGPQKLEREGLGGSETAAIRLAEGFAEQSVRAIVYCNIDEPGYYNGVCYRDSEQLNTSIRSDLFIAWRSPEFADETINTKQLVLWMHDTDVGDRLTEQRASRFDSIVVLTEWHKQFMLEFYPFLDASKLLVIGNGVNLNSFADQVDRDRNRVVYSSSPDRGLDIILEHIWPKVIERVPDAELHIYYGWESFNRVASMPGYEYLAQFKVKLDQLIVSSKGVVQHGRISQSELAREFQKSSIWLYPTYFSETYCITAIEAQLAGCIPVTSRLAGLAETVATGEIIDGDVHDPEIQQKYANVVVSLLNESRSELVNMREQIISNVPAHSWYQRSVSWAINFLNLEK